MATAARQTKKKKIFNLETMHELFGKCIEDGTEDVIMDAYLDAYEEVNRLFDLLGRFFRFVRSDVKDKIAILRDYRKSEESVHYRTIQSMIKYEVEHNITDNKKKASGSRTLLWLHRALEFTSRVTGDVAVAPIDKKMSTMAKKAYDDTISKFHPTIIRKAVRVAVHTLPSQDDFVEKLRIEDPLEAKILLGKVAADEAKIYDIIQRLYTEENLLNLP